MKTNFLNRTKNLQKAKKLMEAHYKLVRPNGIDWDEFKGEVANLRRKEGLERLDRFDEELWGRIQDLVKE